MPCGYGRYDAMVIPQETNLAGIIIEFKSVEPKKVKDLEKLAQLALLQIEAKEYKQELLGALVALLNKGLALR